MAVLVPAAGPLVAARTYLLAELSARDNDLPVGVVPPTGQPDHYALLSRPGSSMRAFLGDYMVRVRVFDRDAVRLEQNTDLLHRLMLHAVHTPITVGDTDVWVTGATAQLGPSDFDDDDVPLFGMQFAVIWTIGLRPETAATPGS